MDHLPASSPSSRRRSDSTVRESLVFPVLERNEQERLESLMKRSDDRGPPPEQRPKRWTWGGPPRACEGESAIHNPQGGRRRRRRTGACSTGCVGCNAEVDSGFERCQSRCGC